MKAEGCLGSTALGTTLGCAEGPCAPPHPSQTAQERSAEGAGPLQAPSLSPDARTKNLIAAINSLQQQQERAEAARHAAAEAAAAAAAEAAALKAALHAALRRAAELDDAEQAVQAGLEARLQEQGALAEQLRLLSKRLASLRGAGPSSQGSSAADPASSPAELQHQLEMQQKREASEELQRRLLARGLGHGTLAALCSDAEHSAVAGGAAPSAQHKDAAEGPRKGSWMGGGGGGGGGGLLGNFSFRRRGS